jgi:hypothetical protein
MKHHPATESLPPALLTASPKFPLWLKISYTLFMTVLIPVYWYYYGVSNFLFFCDLAILITLVGIWTESAVLISMVAVGILLPQALWCADFLVECFGGTLVGMTPYMFDADRSLLLRGLSSFHGWLPFLLFFLIRRTGYDHRGLPLWTGTATSSCLVSFLFLARPGEQNGMEPCNINFVFGPSETAMQSWMPPWLYFLCWLAFLYGVVYLPTHLFLKKRYPISASTSL